jgi:predicted MFS family arabinose efflux permease
VTRPRTVALAGLVSLGVAMGIGRFAFTPLLPAMLAAQQVTLAQAAFLASSNYLGYVVGALLCAAPWSRLLPDARAVLRPGRMVRMALVAVCLLTAGMGLPAPGLWAADRFAAGVASAVAFVFTTSWCLARLARTGHMAMGALIYAGPGIGIMVGGAAGAGMLAVGAGPGTGWLVFAVLALVLTALVWRVFAPDAEDSAAAPAQDAAAPAPAPPRGLSAQTAWLALAYGFAGLGYIVTATFLPVIAREALAGSRWSDVFWPLFGLGTTVGAWLASRIRPGADARVLLAGSYFIQALGIALTLLLPTVAGMAIGTTLLGLPFTAITFFAMREVRRIEPARTTASIALLTLVYGLGQIAGPPLASWLVHRSATAAAGFTVSLWCACAVLAIGGLLFLGSRRAFPLRA